MESDGIMWINSLTGTKWAQVIDFVSLGISHWFYLIFFDFIWHFLSTVEVINPIHFSVKKTGYYPFSGIVSIFRNIPAMMEAS